MGLTADPPRETPWDHDDDPDSEFPDSAFLSGGHGGNQDRYHVRGCRLPEHGLRCPHCNSHRIVPSHLGRRVGSAIGAIAGAATAMARVAGGAQFGAELGALLGTPAGPAGFTLGTVAGAVLGAMAGAAAGCTAGAALGEAVDAKILHNHRCIGCGRSFSLDSA